MNKLIFCDFFNINETMQYTVIKLSPDFPDYDLGGDIDIFCRDIEAFSQTVIGYLQSYVDDSFSIRTSKMPNKVQIDLLEGKDIHFRFDLIGVMPEYNNIKIKPSFFDVVIENTIYKEFEGFRIKVPRVEDECILRYMEYIEYFDKRPDKIKHTDYINALVEKGVLNKSAFLEKIHYFTLIPEKEYHSKNLKEKLQERFTLIQTLFSKANHLLKTKGFADLVRKIYQRLR